MRLELIVDGKLYMDQQVRECELDYWIHKYKLIGFEASKNSWDVMLVAPSKMNEEEAKCILNIKQVIKLKKSGWTMKRLETKFNTTETTIYKRFKDYEDELFNEEMKKYEKAI